LPIIINVISQVFKRGLACNIEYTMAAKDYDRTKVTTNLKLRVWFSLTYVGYVGSMFTVTMWKTRMCFFFFY